MPASIHPTAMVAEGAVIGAGCVIGPYCSVGPQVVLGEGVVLDRQVVVDGNTSIGAGTRVWPFASIGTEPQDLKYKGEPTGVVLGARCQVREGATINRGSVGGDGMTRVGDDCLLMTMAHVGHDCVVGNGVILANNVMLGGHVHVGEGAFLGGGAAVTQTVHIGRLAMISGLAGVTNDIPPFGYVFGLPARLVGFNMIGMRRRGFKAADFRLVRTLVKLLFTADGDDVFQQRLASAEAQHGAEPLAREILDFIARRRGRRALVRWGRMADSESGADE